MFGNSAVIRSRHYVQFRKEKEYAKVLADNTHMLKLLHEDTIQLNTVEEYRKWYEQKRASGYFVLERVSRVETPSGILQALKKGL